jgi:hypothetical protein
MHRVEPTTADADEKPRRRRSPRCTVPAVKLASALAAVALVACASAETGSGPDGNPSGPDAPAGDADPGAADAGTDSSTPSSAQVWRADSADELAAAGHTTAQTAIDPRGALEPFAYFTGLLVRGSDTGVISDPAATTWDQVLAMPTTARIGFAGGTDLQWGGAAPPGVGILDGENWTVRVEGEVFLEVGIWTFTLEPDDTGFLELDPGGGFVRVVNAIWPDPASGTATITADGWYPLRWTDSDTGGNASTVVRYRGPGVASAIAIPRDKLRVRVDHLRGLVHTGFDDQLLAGPSWSALDQTAPADVDYGDGVPADLGIGDDEDWSSRWAGQLRIDVAGAYTFRYVSDDGQRLYIDGVLRTPAAAWAETTQDTTTAAITLAVGWHDIVIDHSEHAAQAAARLTVASGPDLAGQALPVARLRPVQGPVAALAVYESPVRDLGAVTSIDTVSWDEQRPADSDVVVKMRTCAAAAACAAAAWSAPMTEPAGSTPAVTAQRFAQYRVELVSNGDASASVEWVQVDYHAAP